MVDNVQKSAVKLRPEILASPVYRQGKPASAEAFKLSSNENPFPPLPGVAAAVTAELGFNRYPDATAGALRVALGQRLGVGAEEIIVGSGSVALLLQFITAAAGPGDDVVYSWRSFEAYPTLVTVAGARSVPVPNRADGGHDLPALAAAITPATRVVIVCSPNNPTGVTVTRAEFEAFMAAVPADLLVLLDEAYAEFVVDPEAVNGRDLVGRYPNLVILRTFSKAYGLAGLRVGWATGPEAILDAARATAIPLSVTGVAQAAAIASLELEEELFERVSELVSRREELLSGLGERGWNIPVSGSNFIWLATGEYTDAAAQILWDAGLVARPFSGDGVRISIGERESLTPILDAADAILNLLPALHPAKAR